jgi:hypothetical protein
MAKKSKKAPKASIAAREPNPYSGAYAARLERQVSQELSGPRQASIRRKRQAPQRREMNRYVLRPTGSSTACASSKSASPDRVIGPGRGLVPCDWQKRAADLSAAAGHRYDGSRRREC